MRARIAIVGAPALALLALFVSLIVAVQPAHAAVGFTISNGKLYDANGNEFIMRGVSHAHTWFSSQTSAFANIKSLGANTVRVVLSGGRWQPANGPADVANVIGLCKQHRLICVLENHDTTGFGEQGGAVSLDAAVNYWLSLQSVLAGQEKYIIVNIGNEPFGNGSNVPQWTAATSNAIARLRSAGFEHTIMVDAPNWGQDWQFHMRDNAATVFASDPARNTIFSIHMYGVFDTAAEINDYLGRFVAARLPIVVGEFGHNHSDGNPDEDTIMATTQTRGIGYIGWSWSGNGGGVEYLDMVSGFNVNSLTSWGQRIFNGANGIRLTAREASVYGGPQSPSPTASPTPSPTSTPTPTPTPTSTSPAGSCAVTYRNINQWPGGFQGDVSIRNTGSSTVNGWTLRWTFPNGQSINHMWGGTSTATGSAVAVTNAPYTATIPPNGSVGFGFIGNWNGANTNPSSFTLNGQTCALG
jgi:mannan endo-1,4-beta-mannosidase